MRDDHAVDPSRTRATSVGQPIRVAIVDDHEMVAEALAVILQAEPDLEVVGCAGTVADALALVGQRRPHVVVMDFHLPDGDGATAAAAVLQRFPQTRVVMFSSIGSGDLLARAVEAGCSGFVPKDRSGREVASAIRAAGRGESVIPGDVLGALVGRLRQSAPATGTGLTAREREILQLLARGMSSEGVMSELGLTEHTVRSHVERALDKLGARSAIEAVAIAVRDKIITLDQGEHRGNQ